MRKVWVLLAALLLLGGVAVLGYVMCGDGGTATVEGPVKQGRRPPPDVPSSPPGPGRGPESKTGAAGS
ncbi:MAG: hypothetical protein JSV91_12405 [Phycisphaerales bacterium]|nr:MAG: hypothetical protein JSV91_12405 [Phycisphaerales bacterium]